MPAPKDFDEMWRELRGMLPKLRAFLRNPLANTGLSVPGPGVVQVDGDLNVAGVLNVTGDTVIGGTLSLPAGIIDNAALSNPLEIVQAFNNAGGFGLTTTETAKVSCTLTVPAGFTRLYCNATGGITARNTTSATDYMLADIWVGSFFGDTLFSDTDAGRYGTVPCSKQGEITGLTPGSTVTVSLRAYSTNAAWAADPSNIATLNLLAFWLR